MISSLGVIAVVGDASAIHKDMSNNAEDSTLDVQGTGTERIATSFM